MNPKIAAMKQALASRKKKSVKKVAPKEGSAAEEKAESSAVEQQETKGAVYFPKLKGRK